MQNPKTPSHRDRKYLDWLRDQPCFVTGRTTTDSETVDPAHMGVGGTGYKAPDKQALPLLHSLHHKSHNIGSTAFWCDVFKENPAVLRDLLQSYGENIYYKQYLDLQHK